MFYLHLVILSSLLLPICLPAFILALLARIARHRAAAAACHSCTTDMPLQTPLHIHVSEVIRPVGGNAHKTILMVGPRLIDNDSFNSCGQHIIRPAAALNLHADDCPETKSASSTAWHVCIYDWYTPSISQSRLRTAAVDRITIAHGRVPSDAHGGVLLTCI